MFEIANTDCLKGMKEIPAGSVDLILTDLPYAITDAPFDKKIAFEPMWEEFHRVTKYNAAILLFAAGKFLIELAASNLKEYKYKWVWQKNSPTFFVHAKNAPMRKYEEILVFSRGAVNHASLSKNRITYNPQGLIDIPAKYTLPKRPTGVQLRHWIHSEHIYAHTKTNYPADILTYDVVKADERFHPLEKPVALLEYLIKTYSNEGETVLDATMGSGSTGVACMNTGRKFIGYETDEGYYEIANQRITEALANKQQELFC